MFNSPAPKDRQRLALRVPCRRALAALAVGFGLAATWPPKAASATIIERVVAVVDDQPILLSELRRRARPFMAQLMSAPELERAAATSQLMSTLLGRIIDEELEHRAAARAHITVTAQEVEDALTRVAQQNKIAVEDLLTEAQKSGLDARSYREEIRRQLLEAKLLNLKVQGRVRVTEDDVRGSYQRLVNDERATLAFRVAWIRVAVPSGAKKEIVSARKKLAEALVSQAKGGADFAALAKEHSDDPGSRDKGGLLERMKPGSLPKPLDQAAQALEPGSISNVVNYRGDLYVIKLVERDESQLPPYEEAEAELQNRVYMDKMERAKRHWLDGLRKQSHVEVRL